MQIDFLANVLGGEGPLHSLLIIAALLGMVLAVLIWGMEFSGWTISRRGFVRNNVQWNSTTIALIAISAAIYIAGRPIQFQFIPGIQRLADLGVAPDTLTVDELYAQISTALGAPARGG